MTAALGIAGGITIAVLAVVAIGAVAYGVAALRELWRMRKRGPRDDE